MSLSLLLVPLSVCLLLAAPHAADASAPESPRGKGGLPSTAYAVLMHDVRTGDSRRCVLPFWLALQLERKGFRDAGFPDDHIITISPFSSKWLKEIADPTPGFDPLKEGGGDRSPTTAHTWLGEDGTWQGLNELLAAWYKLVFKVEVLPQEFVSITDTREQFVALVAAFKHQGVDLFEEVDYYGADFNWRKLRGVLNGRCDSDSPSTSHCKVVSREGTVNVFASLLLHGQDPFHAAEKHTVQEFDAFGLLPGQEDTDFETVWYPEAARSRVFFSDTESLPAIDFVNLFTRDHLNPALTRGHMIVLLDACHGGSMLFNRFPKLTAKPTEVGRVSVLAGRRAQRLALAAPPTTDKVLFLAFKDRYPVLALNIMGAAIQLAQVAGMARHVPHLNVAMVLAQENSKLRLLETDSVVVGGGKVTADPQLVTAIVNFLQAHAEELRRVVAQRAAEPAAFKEKKQWLQTELAKLGWQKLARNKQLSIVVALSGDIRRVRKAADDRQRFSGAYVHAWGNADIYTMPLNSFFFPH